MCTHNWVHGEIFITCYACQSDCLCAECLKTVFAIPTRSKQIILKHQLALYACIYTVQKVVYHRERADLKSQEVKKCSELHSLCPFLDKHKMLPVGWRIPHCHMRINIKSSNLQSITLKKESKGEESELTSCGTSILACLTLTKILDS
jgi:hypothetical protein